jgi:tyrosyl-tRNA synthetase
MADINSRNVFDVLSERGYIEQITHEEELKELLGKGKITFYIGFDPTADSLHVGSFVQLMVAAQMQRHGHRPVILVGGGTAFVADPTGKTDMRRMLTKEEIDGYVGKFKIQFSKFLDFEGENAAIIVNNADWLLGLNYIEFIRDIGVHFSVNKMLTAECFKQRMEKGLSFFEFNYMLLQSYDFLELFRKYDCNVQLGGNDQWSNIIAGVELIRKVEKKPAFGMTFKLLLTAEGKKMGKTENGALWLDADKTSPYDFYQYWRNIDDASVEDTLFILTFLPVEEVKLLGALKDREINEAKKILAYEITKIIHGEEEANKAKATAESLFEAGSMNIEMPTTEIAAGELSNGISVSDLLLKIGLVLSKGEGKRLIMQGGISLIKQDNEIKITDFAHMITTNDFDNGELVIKKGKKVFHKVIAKG